MLEAFVAVDLDFEVIGEGRGEGELEGLVFNYFGVDEVGGGDIFGGQNLYADFNVGALDEAVVDILDGEGELIFVIVGDLLAVDFEKFLVF